MKYLFLIPFFTLIFEVNAQSLSLEEAISLAQKNSVDAAIAENRMNTAYWTYRTYLADQLPEISFSGSLPTYRRAYENYLQADGSYTYLPINSLAFNGRVTAKQQVSLTGGLLSLHSSLDFNRTMNNSSNLFMSAPFALTYTQPLFGVNRYKWERRIEPVRFKEATAAYLVEREEVTLSAISLFFNWLLAKESLIAARQNLLNADKLRDIAISRRKIGQISENDLMQLKLSALQAKATLTDAVSAHNTQLFRIKSFLGIEGEQELEPQLPQRIPQVKMEYEEVLEKALVNNPFSLNVLRRRMEADYAVASAKGERQSINIYASVGFNGVEPRLRDSYVTLRDNQVAEVGISMPLLDWGKRKAKVKVAESNREVEKEQLRRREMNFRQDIFLLVENYNNQTRQLDIAQQADTIAQKRYLTTIETFIMGKIDILELNDAQSRKDSARRTYIQQIYLLWNYFHDICSVSLYDFINQCPIEFSLENNDYGT